MDLDPDVGQGRLAGGILHRALEGVAGSVVVQDEPGAAANRIERRLGSQSGAAGFLVARAAGFTGTFAAGAVFAGTLPLGDSLGRGGTAVSALAQFGVAGAAHQYSHAQQGRQHWPDQNRPCHRLLDVHLFRLLVWLTHSWYQPS